jgi:hypothetical protein
MSSHPYSYPPTNLGLTSSVLSVIVELAIPMRRGTSVLMWIATPSIARRIISLGRRAASAGR